MMLSSAGDDAAIGRPFLMPRFAYDRPTRQKQHALSAESGEATRASLELITISIDYISRGCFRSIKQRDAHHGKPIYLAIIEIEAAAYRLPSHRRPRQACHADALYRPDFSRGAARPSPRAWRRRRRRPE